MVHGGTWQVSHDPIEDSYLNLYLDGIVMKHSWRGKVRNISLLVASAVHNEGYREISGIARGHKKNKPGWSSLG